MSWTSEDVDPQCSSHFFDGPREFNCDRAELAQLLSDGRVGVTVEIEPLLLSSSDGILSVEWRVRCINYNWTEVLCAPSLDTIWPKLLERVKARRQYVLDAMTEENEQPIEDDDDGC